MPRAVSKEQVKHDTQTKYQKLIELVESIPDQNRRFVVEDRYQNIRDILGHLHAWHLMFFEWHQIGCIEGKTPVTPKAGYNWRMLKELNAEIQKSYQVITLEQAKAKLKDTHNQMMDLIHSHTDTELITPGFFPWTKQVTLGSYFMSNGSSHYEWAIKKIKMQIKGWKQIDAG